ncbi:MAG: cupin domain-containing protein [Gammaproteobacteria bacterium]|nr:cupin domain-containing protein [Gammaproteobacteria bacterium]
MDAKVNSSREEFIEDLIANNFTTFFVATHPKYSTSNPAFRFTPTPVSVAVPYSWSYADARERLMHLSSLLTAEEAERRNINFVNPALKDFMPAAALPTLRGGIQLLLPDEQAYSHRHSANAFRLVFEAPKTGAYTNVEGNRLPMSMGDLILTPNWTWHDHHNEGDSNVIWYDGLDVLFAYWMGGVFYEEMVDVTGDEYQAVLHEADSVTDNFGAGMIHRKSMYPDHIPASDNTLIYYPYSKARQLLSDLAQHGAGDPYEGILVEYVNPVNCGPTFPTMSTSLRMIKERSTVEAMHRTENVLFITMEGSVTFHLPDNQTFTTKPHDVTAIPSWVPYSISNKEQDPAVLFSQSDRPVFEALSFYREEKA